MVLFLSSRSNASPRCVRGQQRCGYPFRASSWQTNRVSEILLGLFKSIGLSLRRSQWKPLILTKPKPSCHGPWSRLPDGKPFIIAKAGKPLVKVTPLDTPTGTKVRKWGFLAGQFVIPSDFDNTGSAEIPGGCLMVQNERAAR